MERDIRNKVIVITGGAEGLGYSFAEKFLEHHAKTVIILDINETKGTNAVNVLNNKFGTNNAMFIKCDVTKDLDVISKDILDTYKQVDVLINNAGIVDEEDPRRILNINLVALVEWSMKFREHMRKDKGGSGGTIINIGSLYSYFIDPYLVFYKTTKFAVLGFSRSLGHEYNYQKFGVRVIVLCPGFTSSSLTNQLTPWKEQKEDFQEFMKGEPWQMPDDVAAACIDIFKTADSGTAWSIIGGQTEKLE